MTVLIKGGYIVKKDSLSDAQQARLVKDLTVQPVTFGMPNGASRAIDTFKVFRESKTRFRLPRFYGVQHFGAPTTNKLDTRIPEISLKFAASLKPELQQDVACSTVISQLQTQGGGILSLPTGYGKTTCALYILCQLKVRALIVVHKEFLMNQWAERIAQFIPDATVGVVRQNKVDTVGKSIVLVMLQSVSMKEYPEGTFDGFGITIIDETHHICSKTFSRSLFCISTKYMLGLSATPVRKDGLTKVLHWFLGPIAFAIERENQEQVIVEVVKYTCEEYSKAPPVSASGYVSMPAVVNILTALEHRSRAIVQPVIEKLREGRKIIILSDRRSHCEYLMEHVQALSSKSCGLYMGGMKQAALKENEDCDAIFATYSLAHEGLDIPALNTLIMATPKTDVVQACGRILRENGQKSHPPCIVDIVDKFATLQNQHRRRCIFYKQAGFNISLKKQGE